MSLKPCGIRLFRKFFNIQDETYFSNISRKKSIKKYEKYNQKGFDLEC